MNDASKMSSHNPDVLACLANLSNDEVFTPPEVANAMLDLLPAELFTNPATTFLDPACKSGVFLREIAKRLIVGLEPAMPNLQERLDHIFHKQLFGIAITELTGLLSRRSVYCSKYPNSIYSVSHFESIQGNIRYRNIRHIWNSGRCVYCGASEDEYGESKRGTGMEFHAYEFIHTTRPEDIFKMKFDVIIGNPPYQLSDGGAQASAKPIYQLFINQAKKIKPRYLSMIVPSRWMVGGKGLDTFRNEMIHDKHITKLFDYLSSKDVFTGVDIKGGVCFFLWDRDKEVPCEIHTFDTNGENISVRYLADENDDIFIRDNRLLSIKRKIESAGDFLNAIVSARKPYGLEAETMVNAEKYGLPAFSYVPFPDGYRILGLGDRQKRMWKYIPRSYPIPKENKALDKYKVFIAEAYGCGSIGEVPSTPVLSTPGELCTETFLEIGPFDTKEEASNLITYIRTKFFRCLVGIQKQTQHTTAKVYRFVPLQDFTSNSDIDWDESIADIDKQLYEKYKFDDDEIAFIESMIKPMDLDGDE